jgi:penicillin-binding protein 2
MRFPISEDTVEKVTQGMEDVVDPKFAGGTGHVAFIKGVELCGKSGSAQTIGAEGLAKAKNRADFKDNAWFVGFAPRRNPEIVVTAFVQSTQKHGGEIAAPIVRDVVKAYYDKKNEKNGTQLTAVNAPTDTPSVPVQKPLTSQPIPQQPKATPSAPPPDALPQPKNSNGAGKPTHQSR